MSAEPVPAVGAPTRRSNHGKTIMGVLRRECSFGQGEYYVRGDWMHLSVIEEGPKKGQRDIPHDEKGNVRPVEVSLNAEQAKANIHKFDNREEIAEFFGLQEVINPSIKRHNAVSSLLEKKKEARKAELAEQAQVISAAVVAGIVAALQAVGLVPSKAADDAPKPRKGKKAEATEASPAEAPSRTRRSA